jgi:hypothetical protein
VGLDPETLALATPARDSVESLVDYMKDPTSYDGEYSIADVHPSMSSSDVFVKMRDLDDDDLRADRRLHPGGPEGAGHPVGRRQGLLLSRAFPCFAVVLASTVALWGPRARSQVVLQATSARSGGSHCRHPWMPGCLLYHHSCRAGASRWGKRVITVRVGRAPGWSSSTA